MSDEDELVQALMDTIRKNYDTVELRVEEHYNHYGDRGIIDLTADKGYALDLYEVKSESAVVNATGANEIIRQCKRHAEYYFADKGEGRHTSRTLNLVFYLTERTWNHFVENIGMYRAFYEQDVGDCRIDVSFQHPDSEGAMKVLHPALGYHTDRFHEQLERPVETPFDVAGVEP